MLATYQAKVTNNQIEWIDPPPNLNEAEVTITVFPKGLLAKSVKDKKQIKRDPPKELQGLMTFDGNIVDMTESYQHWEYYE